MSESSKMDRKYLEGDTIAEYDSPALISSEFNNEASFSVPYAENETIAEELIVADNIPHLHTNVYPADDEQVTDLPLPGQKNSNPMIPVTTAFKPKQSISNSVALGDSLNPIVFAEEYPSDYSDIWSEPTVRTSQSDMANPLLDTWVDAKRPPRSRLNTNQQNILETHFQFEKTPDTLTREILSHRTSLPPKRVSIWFQNRRARERNLSKK